MRTSARIGLLLSTTGLPTGFSLRRLRHEPAPGIHNDYGKGQLLGFQNQPLEWTVNSRYIRELQDANEFSVDLSMSFPLLDPETTLPPYSLPNTKESAQNDGTFVSSSADSTESADANSSRSGTNVNSVHDNLDVDHGEKPSQLSVSGLIIALVVVGAVALGLLFVVVFQTLRRPSMSSQDSLSDNTSMQSAPLGVMVETIEI